MKRVVTSGLLLALAGCECGFQPVIECDRAPCDGGHPDSGTAGGAGGGNGNGGGIGAGGGGMDAGTGDGGACDSGTPGIPHLCLAPNQPAICPEEFPTSGPPCIGTASCDYLYPTGTAPSGCEAFCVVGDGGFVWNVPICF